MSDTNNKSESQRIFCLDGLKGVCACIIAFFWHYQHFSPEVFPMYSVFKPLYDAGNVFTDVFFLLSGFGMVLGYEERILKNQVGAGRFWANRVKRIFPIMILSTFVTAILQYIYMTSTNQYFVYGVENFNLSTLFLQFYCSQMGILGDTPSFNGPAWFIGEIMICYMVFYILLSLLKNKPEIVTCIYVVLAEAGMAIAMTNSMGYGINGAVGRAIAGFFVGCILAKIYEKKDLLNEKRIGIAALILIAITEALTVKFGWGFQGILPLFTIIAFGPFLIIAILFLPILNKIFASKVLRKLGDMSLSIFMWHYPVQLIFVLTEYNYRIRIDYSSPVIWLIYVVAVFIFTLIYDFLLKDRINNFYKLFCAK